MDLSIWNDLRIRMRNLRSDMIGQWQGDLDNSQIGGTIQLLQMAEKTWDIARPNPDPPSLLESFPAMGASDVVQSE